MMKYSKIIFKPSPGNFLLFLVDIILIGFSLGTFVLLFLVRYVVNYSVGHQLQQSTQNLYVNIIIGIYLIVSLILAVILTKTIIKMTAYWQKAAIVTALVAVFVFTLWLWFNPDVVNSGEQDQITSENINTAVFDFGAYPSKAQIIRLKKEHYTAVISLLHPAVVPFEPKLITEEEALLKSMGFPYIHIPMLPWVSKNEDALNKISGIINSGRGKYFVHCYLGKDRVNVVKNFIRNKNGQIANETIVPESRSLEEVKSFERGAIFKLDKGVYLIPYPTDEEFFGYLLSGSIKQIVSLLDPENPDDTLLIRKELKIISQYNVAYKNRPLRLEPYNPDSVQKIVDYLKTLPRPLVVHAYFSDKFSAEALRLTYQAQKQTLLPSLFNSRMVNGAVVFLNSSCITGNTPVKSEFKGYLYFKGVRNIAYTGDPGTKNLVALKNEAKRCGLTWEDIRITDSTGIKNLVTKGTWYIFGSKTEDYQRISIFKSNK